MLRAESQHAAFFKKNRKYISHLFYPLTFQKIVIKNSFKPGTKPIIPQVNRDIKIFDLKNILKTEEKAKVKDHLNSSGSHPFEDYGHVIGVSLVVTRCRHDHRR